jgi:hypothetical protein
MGLPRSHRQSIQIRLFCRPKKQFAKRRRTNACRIISRIRRKTSVLNVGKPASMNAVLLICAKLRAIARIAMNAAKICTGGNLKTLATVIGIGHDVILNPKTLGNVLLSPHFY